MMERDGHGAVGTRAEPGSIDLGSSCPRHDAGLLEADFLRDDITVAVGGMNDTRQHLGDVVRAVLGRWRIFERYDFGGHGAKPPRKSWCCRLEGEATQPGRIQGSFPGTRKLQGRNKTA
jgi:hypothetical protein